MSLFEATQDPFLLAAPFRLGRDVIRTKNISESIGFAVLGAHVRLRSERIVVRPILVSVLQTAFHAATYAQLYNHHTGLQVRSSTSGYGELTHAFFVGGDVGQAQLECVFRQGQLPEDITEDVIMPSPDCYVRTNQGEACPVNALTRLEGPEKLMGIWRISPLPEMK
ncbi:MAG TPA: hypothetical protein VLG47_04410 [Candidatus Saccharimonadales bacterium]|nr:hypothetical protein [Candidatus Saccharimonadales bacterium]